MTRPMDIKALPAHLRQRVTAATDAAGEREPPGAGEFVLCWLHHAVRGHENPVIDAAIEVGNTLGRPVLVYQGLGGRHRFNSDRHHAFIMQGAADLQAELDDRGIAYAFHLPTDPSAPSPLRSLLRRASVFVTEDFPAPPFPAWTARLAERSTCPSLLVDGSCLMPLRSPRKRFTRAFKFRDAAKGAWRELINAPWRDAVSTVPAYRADAGALGFEPIDFSEADIDALCAACDIDHSVPPVGRIRGGSRAGYERWRIFQRDHLSRYDRRRNDAADMDAVSGLSPYLHHGHISPFRIAREASAAGGKGAEKFLDELLVWRELAFNFCAHTGADSLETLDAIPDWARQTLQRRAGDPREQLLSWEELARGRSGSSLWDQAQRSLLQNGELHNNLRMTWGKAVLDWTPGPGEALRLLIDLNHRYALDGSDPNSYGGLLWCLGQFDRAFEPEREVLGTVRPRPVDDHADRLRPQRYASAVDARRGYDPIRVAVVGAGISGLACARTLADQGVDVCVLDRGRGPGGRTSTRQSRDSTGAIFDHGAPFFQVADARFGRYVRSWIEQGICSRWAAGTASWREGSLVAVPPDAPLIVGTPGMSAICEHLASDLDVRTGQVVSTLRPSAPGWLLETGEAAQTDRFDAVVLAMAPEQARRLLGGDASSMREQLAGITSHPVWAGMFILENTDPGLPDVVRFEPEHDLGLLVRNDHKPGRASLPAGRTALVAHASSRWSSARLDASREAVADEFADLVDQWLRAGGLGGRVVSRAAHRWGLARPASQIAGACLFDRDRALAVCGDGFAGTGVEAAFLSGQAAAGRVLSLRHAATPTATEAGPLFAGGSDDHAQRGGAG